MLDQSDFLAPPIPASAEIQVEMHMRWLADNIGTSLRPELWMMMDVNLAKEYNNAPFHQDR